MAAPKTKKPKKQNSTLPTPDKSRLTTHPLPPMTSAPDAIVLVACLAEAEEAPVEDAALLAAARADDKRTVMVAENCGKRKLS